MIEKLYSELMESITSDLKKQHSGEQWYSAAIAPTSKEKYYKQFLIFYKSAELSGASQDNWFKDVEVYALRYLTDDVDNMGHFDEFFHASSTYVTMLKDKKLSILNCVKNKKTDIGKFETIDKEMRSRLRLDSASLARGSMSVQSSNSDLADAKPVGKLRGYVLYQKGKKFGLYTKDEKMTLPFQTGLKVGWIEDKMISAETSSGYVLYTLEGKEVAKSSLPFSKFIDHKMAMTMIATRAGWDWDISNIKFYNLQGYVGEINKIPGLLEVGFNRSTPPSSINLGCGGYGRLHVKILGKLVEISEPDSFNFISDSDNRLMRALSGIEYKAIFDSIFKEE